MSTTEFRDAPSPLPPSAGRGADEEEAGPLVGRNVGGYEVTATVGEGPTGVVYRAQDLMGAQLVLKVFHREICKPEAIDELWGDLQGVAELGSRHVVETYDSGWTDDGCFFVVMEGLSGLDLEKTLREKSRLGAAQAVPILKELCSALDAAHAAGLVHGDLKPRNVLLVAKDEAGVSARLVDFGSRRLFVSDAPSTGGRSGAGMLLGNPFYMAPEQFGGECDARSDVYALGVILYEMFSGALPFTGPNYGRVMMRHISEPPAPPPGVADDLAAIILKALAKRPDDRFQSVKDLARAITGWDSTQRRAVGRQTIAVAVPPPPTGPMARTSGQFPAARTSGPMAIARSSGEMAAVAPPAPRTSGQMAAVATPSGRFAAVEPSDEKSVETSLMDFVNQANATLTEDFDGWDIASSPAQAKRQARRAEAESTAAIDKGASAPSHALLYGGIAGAFVVGAAVVFLAVRLLLPTSAMVQAAQPQAAPAAPVAAPGIVAAPAPAPTAQPAVAAPAEASPALQVQPLAAPAAAAPAAAPAAEAAPAPAPIERAHAATRHRGAAPKPAVAAAVAAASSTPAAEAAPAEAAPAAVEAETATSDATPAEEASPRSARRAGHKAKGHAAASAPAADKPAKPATVVSKGGWVDPFAQ